MLIGFCLLFNHAELQAQYRIDVQPAKPPLNFISLSETANGIPIHFVKGGSGEPLLLVHGFGENWYVWNRLLTRLSESFTVMAIDLPGIGESAKPGSGYDKKTMAATIRALVLKLGYRNICIAGHDIGLMVAYSYAAQFPGEVKKLALLDAVLPGIEPMWTESGTKKWWFGFFARPAAPALIQGREAIFFDDFWSIAMHLPGSFTKEEKEEFIRAYSTKGSLLGSFQWFSTFDTDSRDNVLFSKNKLTMPVLTIAGEFGAAKFLGPQAEIFAARVKEVVIPNAGHWLLQEQTEAVQLALADFLLSP